MTSKMSFQIRTSIQPIMKKIFYSRILQAKSVKPTFSVLVLFRMATFQALSRRRWLVVSVLDVTSLMLPSSHLSCASDPLIVLKPKSNRVTELFQNLRWRPLPTKEWHVFSVLVCHAQHQRGWPVAALRSRLLSLVGQSRLLCFPLGPPSSGASVSSVCPLCKTRVSVHRSLSLLPHKVELRQLPRHEHFLKVRCPSRPPPHSALTAYVPSRWLGLGL